MHGPSKAVAPAVEELVAELFDEQADRLVGLACLLLRDRADAEDVVQEAFLRLQRHASSIVDEGREVAYLRSIVLNLARSRLRRRRLAGWVLPKRVGASGPEEVVELRDEQRRVVLALRRLSARQRECLVLRYYEDLGDQAIADTLGLSITSVRTHLRRATAALKKSMGSQPEGSA